MNNTTHQQDWLDDFDTIRSFHDKEVTVAIAQLLEETPFIKQFNTLFGEYLSQGDNKALQSEFISALRTADSINKLQYIERQFVEAALKHTLKTVTQSGLPRNQDQHTGFLFISNHRDIVLDPLLINWSVMQSDLASCHCAIGDNLLVAPSGNLIARLNKCFAVLRSVKSPKAMVSAMKTQSSYIRYLRFNTQDNIWLAQKEGRSKDNSDKTNPALIKMLGLSKPKDSSLGSYIKALKLVPVSISYEWDPCDLQKAQELIAEERGTYKKEGEADLKAVKDGLVGDKGRIHLSFDLDFCEKVPNNANHIEIAALIDKSIQAGYQLYPVNYAAKNLITGNKTPQQTPDCTAQEILEATNTLLDKLSAQPEEIKTKVLQSYANPVINQE